MGFCKHNGGGIETCPACKREKAEYGVYAPTDYKNPHWSTVDRVHNWRNYVSAELQCVWDSFSDEQKAIIAANADAIAGNEQWD